MAMSLLGQQLSVTQAVQTVDIPTAQQPYTFKNDGDESVYLRMKDDGIPFTGVASALKALGGSELKAGEAVTFWPPFTQIDIVCATGLTATVRVIPGVLTIVYDISLVGDIDIGNVHLLNLANNKIDPATEQKQDDIIADTNAIETNTNVLPAAVDSTTGALVTVTMAHHEAHEATNYICRSRTTIAKNGTFEILVVTPDTANWGHVTLGFSLSTSTSLIELFEGVTTSADGAIANSRNRNRNSPDNNTVLIYTAPTVTGGAVAGNLLEDGLFGSGKNSFGAGSRDSEEGILKQNTKYLIRVTEQNIAAVNFNYSIEWYEHENAA